MAAQDFQRKTIYRQIRPGHMVAYRGIESLDGSRVLVLAHTQASTWMKKTSNRYVQTAFAGLDLNKDTFFSNWDEAIAAYDRANPKILR